MGKKIVLPILLLGMIGVGLWGGARFRSASQHIRLPEAVNTSIESSDAIAANPEAWEQAVAKVKDDRSTDPKAAGALVVPPELRHYEDRHWFLAAQVAEVVKYNLGTCQDYIDLAAMIQRGDLAPLPAVTDTYVLLGVGAKADESAFTKFVGDDSIDPSNQTQLTAAYKRLDEKKASLQKTIAELKAELSKSNTSNEDKRTELEATIAACEQELMSTERDQISIAPENRQKLLRDYESLKQLAENFNGRRFNLDNPADRQALKVNMLSSLRPAAVKILEEVAAAYHREFARPLPISSLVRPEQYQHALRRVNRYAVLIDTPPHSTGLAFDIDYRYMGTGEQTFVMAALARMKQQGRIEVLRERGANFHVFAFVNGTRPGDDLIAASLDKAVAPGKQIKAPEPKPPAKTKRNR